MGEERLAALIQESLSVAASTKAIKPSDLSRVIVDTTVQPKNVTLPTDAKLLNRTREKPVRLAQRHGVSLRQSYAPVGKFALIQHQRYAYAKQFKRANRALKTLRTYLGRVIRDIGRKIDGNSGLEAAFAKLLPLARRVREQQQRQRGPKVYSLYAPAVEMHGQGQGPPHPGHRDPGRGAAGRQHHRTHPSTTRDTAATMRRPITSSGSSSPARSEG
ncbi:hypothetical protein IVB19_38780 (plasmid) [Bradyrhizobium sp. 187]|nr:hypothetical protein IVB19_38780 [Bradyrhizobium sp. 187]